MGSPSASLTSRSAPARYAQDGSCPSYALSKLDDDSLDTINNSQDVQNQLLNNPDLTAQLSQAPELFKLMMNQGNA